MAFEGNLGPSFIQTPPNFATKNFDVLASFLDELPENFEVFVELRHPGWYENQDLLEKVFVLLEQQQAGFIITDTAGRRDCVHMRLTTPSAFIRFVGNNNHPSDFDRLNVWADRIAGWNSKGIRSVYMFMHQPDEVHSPFLCKHVTERFKEVIPMHPTS